MLIEEGGKNHPTHSCEKAELTIFYKIHSPAKNKTKFTF